MPSKTNVGSRRYETDHPPALTGVASKHSTRRGDSTRGPEETKKRKSTARPESTRYKDSTKRQDSTKHGDSSKYQDSTRVGDSIRRGDSSRRPESRYDEGTLTRTNTGRCHTAQTYHGETRQTFAPGMTGHLEAARQDLVRRHPGQELVLLSRHGSTVQRSGSRSMQLQYGLPPPQYGPPVQYGPPAQYGPDPYGDDTVFGRLEAVGMVATDMANGLQEGIRAYEQSGLRAAGAVYAKTIIQAKQKVDARFPNGLT